MLNITNANDEEKKRLRGAIKYFSGDKNNMPVFVRVDEEDKSCGNMYVTDEILEVFRWIIGNENVLVNNI